MKLNKIKLFSISCVVIVLAFIILFKIDLAIIADVLTIISFILQFMSLNLFSQKS